MKGEWRIWELGQLGFRALSDLGANVTMCQSPRLPATLPRLARWKLQLPSEKPERRVVN